MKLIRVTCKDGPKYEIAKINGDVWRPGMPKNGWIVRYELSPKWGWTKQHVCASEEEAKEFASKLK